MRVGWTIIDQIALVRVNGTRGEARKCGAGKEFLSGCPVFGLELD
jgi:hypothetical protein